MLSQYSVILGVELRVVDTSGDASGAVVVVAGPDGAADSVAVASGAVDSGAVGVAMVVVSMLVRIENSRVWLSMDD